VRPTTALHHPSVGKNIVSQPDPPTVEELFEQAVKRSSPDERRAFLDGACANHAQLRDRVGALLRAYEQAGDFLKDPAAATPATLQALIPEGPGSIIDKYKLLQLIGEGGFGVVYMAEQEKPIRRKVALKIIKLGMDTKHVIARFEAERQALAMMEHPHIAKVLDAGATATGRPYFVMELVRGVPITEYCDKENLGTRQRLQLFMDVCRAVQHAHQKGIIHRDLKPNNVLVTLHDGKPVPKVIDFGIARATNRELTDKTLFTELQQFIGTPEYMSPEQAKMSGLDIDTRSDIYSLGVLLYELLTGSTPFDGKQLRSAAMGEVQRIIREEEPHKPSTRLSTLGDELLSIARHRREQPAALAKALKGDLDWIVMKALEKDRVRRYETANGFAMDIGRYLNDEPVVASPPGAAYRLRKFVRRNKAGVAVAAVLALALLLGSTGTTGGMLWAINQMQRAEAAEQATQDELERQSETWRIVSDMIYQATKVSGQPERQRILKEEIVDPAAERLRNGEINDALVAAELHFLTGFAYNNLAVTYDRALMRDSERHLRTARDIRLRILGDDHPETLKVMRHLARVLGHLQRFEEAESLCLDAISAQTRILGATHTDTLASLQSLARVYRMQGRDDEAERIYVDLLAIHERLQPAEGLAAATSVNLAEVYFEQGRPAEAAPLYESFLEYAKRVRGDEYRLRSYAQMRRLAACYQELGRHDDALPLFRDVLETQLEIAEKNEATVRVLNSVAWSLLTVPYEELRDPARALPVAERACAREEAAAGGNLWNYLDTLALAQHQLGNHAAAVRTQQRALELIPTSQRDETRAELRGRLAEYEAALSGEIGDAKVDGS
jgi:serine/threonine protein kinase